MKSIYNYVLRKKYSTLEHKAKGIYKFKKITNKKVIRKKSHIVDQSCFKENSGTQEI